MNIGWLNQLSEQHAAAARAMAMAGAARMAARVDAGELQRRINALANPKLWDNIVEKVYREVHRKLAETTPKRWTGNTRRGWVLARSEAGLRVLDNTTTAMRYMEFGTPRLSPQSWIYPRVKKALFIPLTRRAATFNRGAASWYTTAGDDDERQQVAERRVNGMLTGERKNQLVFGEDYVLAKRVRGIAPRRIAFKAQALGRAMLVQEMDAVVTKVFNG